MQNEKPKSPLDSEVSIYRNLKQVEVLKLREILKYDEHLHLVGDKPLRILLEGLDERVDNYRKLGVKTYKQGAPSYTPAGVFSNPRTGKPEKPSNQVQLDFDDQMPDIESIFKKHKFITAASKSFSGKSFYLLVNTDGKDYAGSFHALVEFFEKLGLRVDVSVSSENEIRYLSKSSEVLIRENPNVYRGKKQKPVSRYDQSMVSGDGSVIPMPKDLMGKVHYSEFVSWIGINNQNGVPLEKLISHVDPRYFEASSHIAKDPSKVKYHIERVYSHYQEQHGKKPNESGDVTIGGIKLAAFEHGELEKKFLINIPHGKDRGDSMSLCAVKATRYCIEKYKLVVDAQTKEAYKRFNNHLVLIPGIELAGRFIAETAYMNLGMRLLDTGLPAFTDAVKKCLLTEAARHIKTPRNAFNLSNGVLEFMPKENRHEFREHSDDDLFTYILDYPYDPGANCPKFKKFLDRVMPEKQSQDLFFEYVATMFFGDEIQIDKTLFLIGGGANGKSTLLDVLTDLFGSGVQEFSLDRATNADQSPAEMFVLKGKILGICHEATRIKEQELFNQLSTRRPMAMWKMRIDRFTSGDYPRVIIASNHMIRLASTDAGERRFLGISMDARILEEEQDRGLRKKLFDERSGILNLVLAGFERILLNNAKFTESENSAAIKAETIMANNNVGKFLNELGLSFPAKTDSKLFPVKGSKIDPKNHNYSGLYKIRFSTLFNFWEQWNGDDKMFYRAPQFGVQLKRNGGELLTYPPLRYYIVSYDQLQDLKMETGKLLLAEHFLFEADLERRKELRKTRR